MSGTTAIANPTEQELARRDWLKRVLTAEGPKKAFETATGERKKADDKLVAARQALTEAKNELAEQEAAVARAQKRVAEHQQAFAAARVPGTMTAETLRRESEQVARDIAEIESSQEVGMGLDIFGAEPDAEQPAPPPLSAEDEQRLQNLRLRQKQLQDWKDALGRKTAAEQETPLKNAAEALLPELRSNLADRRQAVVAAKQNALAARGDRHEIGILPGAREEGLDGPANDDDDAVGDAPGAPRGYDPQTGLISGSRPAKPAALRDEDEEYEPLTAHHLYPWNKIQGDLNRALDPTRIGKAAETDRPSEVKAMQGEMQRLLDFGHVKVAASFWEEFAKPAAERSAEFAKTLNDAVTAICWSPGNVFLGPLGSKRGDDPHDGVDTAFTKSGLPSPASALAEMLARPTETGKTGIGAEHDGLTEILRRNVQAAQSGDDAKPRPYDKSEWEDNEDVLKVRRGRVRVNAGLRGFDPEVDALVAESEAEAMAVAEMAQKATADLALPRKATEAARLGGDAVAQRLSEVDLRPLPPEQQDDVKTALAGLREVLRTLKSSLGSRR
jgi:hypothetical protein